MTYSGKGPIRHGPFGVLLRLLACFHTPPTEPDVQLSLHPALQRSAFRLQDYSWTCHSRSISQLHLTERPKFIRLAGTFYRRDVDLLASFAMYTAFPYSDYYDASDAPISHWQTACLSILIGASHVHRDGLYKVI